MKLLAYLYFLLLKLRYKFNISGFNEIDKNKQYIIFPNHQALVDPQIVVSLLSQKIKVSPVISETYYNIPILKQFFKIMGAVSMGDIQRGTGSIDDVKNAFKNIEDGIKDKKNILLYPAGQLYSQGYEVIKGKKSAYNLVQILPENVEILVIKTTGLWGSIWSKAWQGDTPNFFKTFFSAFIILIGNILFLIPKREVKVEIVNFTQALKEIKEINEFNQVLEDFYNKDGEEIIKYNPHFFFYNNVKNKSHPIVIKGSIAYLSKTSTVDENIIPKEVKENIIGKIFEIKQLKKENININSILINDLYFDSLDAAEIKSYIQANFTGASNPPITDLKSVGDLCLMAIGKSVNTEKLKDCEWKINENSQVINLIEKINNKNYNSILDLWKENFSKNKSETFIWDNILGLQTKKDFILKAYFIANRIKKLHGEYVGIMMPAVSGASLLIIATYLAGKTPVMFNWTLGKDAFNHCVKFSKVENIITVSSFYDRVKNDFLEEHNEKGIFLFLENLLKGGKISEKISALVKSFYLPIPVLGENAVILFTSGSESLPKAVALTHTNLIENIKGALSIFNLKSDDILLGFLPPFHSFGFTINTIMPLITGLKVANTPDPNDAKTILEIIKHTGTTAITSTPTFLKMIMALAKNDDLKNLRYVVVGAEKCQKEIFEKFSELSPNGVILEGYGITECSPVVSINPIVGSKPGTVGKIIPNLKYKIIDINSPSVIPANAGIYNYKEVPIGEQGMIYISGSSIFNGYLDEKLESPFEYFEGKRYYKTGDLGFVDSDLFLTITGRLKRFIKIAGEMISLPFIENILLEKYGSDEGLVIAIEALEKDGNAKIVLFSIQKIEIEEVNNYLRERGVSNLVKISENIVVEKIPILGTGKTDYKVLKGLINF